MIHEFARTSYTKRTKTRTPFGLSSILMPFFFPLLPTTDTNLTLMLVHFLRFFAETNPCTVELYSSAVQ
jgi:hypothetical protein